jgi:hypothetical protein
VAGFGYFFPRRGESRVRSGRSLQISGAASRFLATRDRAMVSARRRTPVPGPVILF